MLYLRLNDVLADAPTRCDFQQERITSGNFGLVPIWRGSDAGLARHAVLMPCWRVTSRSDLAPQPMRATPPLLLGQGLVRRGLMSAVRSRRCVHQHGPLRSHQQTLTDTSRGPKRQKSNRKAELRVTFS
jgi:hypothetical protein